MNTNITQNVKNVKPTRAVIEIGKMNFEGNITPHSWYSHLTFPNGKPQLVAITILSDIVYWYRPSETRDDATGRLIGYKKKFDPDKLQRSYQYYVDLYGFGKEQARNAIDYLVDFGVIAREFRHFASKTGMPMSNVMFVEPIVEKLKEITYSHLDTPHVGTETDMVYRHENRDGMDIETDTYTEITTDIDSNNSSSSPQPDENEFPPIDPTFAKVSQLYKQEINAMFGSTTSDLLKGLADTYPLDWIEQAFKEAVRANVRRLNYIEGILKRWQEVGHPTLEKPKRTRAKEPEPERIDESQYVEVVPEEESHELAVDESWLDEQFAKFREGHNDN